VRSARVSLVAAALALATAATAHAFVAGDDISAQPEVVQALTDARTYWHDAQPGCPAITVTVVEEPDPDVMAATTTCTIAVNVAWLDAAPDRTRFCALFAHEYGHLLGHGHEPSPQDVDKVMVTRGTPAYCRTFNARETIPKVCRWPRWARATPKVRRLYADGRKRAARRTYLEWRKHHPRAKLRDCDLG
jgi:hypothetical protein